MFVIYIKTPAIKRTVSIFLATLAHSFPVIKHLESPSMKKNCYLVVKKIEEVHDLTKIITCMHNHSSIEPFPYGSKSNYFI